MRYQKEGHTGHDPESDSKHAIFILIGVMDTT